MLTDSRTMPWSHRSFVASSVIEREGSIGRPYLCDFFEKTTLRILEATPHKIAIFANKIIYTIVVSEASHSTDFESRAFGFISPPAAMVRLQHRLPSLLQTHSNLRGCYFAFHSAPSLPMPSTTTSSSSPQLHIDIHVHNGRHHRHC